MPGGAEAGPVPAVEGFGAPALRREAIRAAAAFSIYLALYPLWTYSGAHASFGRLVLAFGQAILPWVQHFPAGRSIESLRIPHMDLLIVLALSCCITAWGVRFPVRMRRLAAITVAIVLAQTTAIVLQAQIDATRDLWTARRLMILLPREFQVAVWTKYMLFEFGLQLAPFVILALHTAWGSGYRLLPRAGRSGGWRVWAATIGMIVLGIGVAAWIRVRETDQRHVETHVAFGNRMLRDGDRPAAEEQYRAAIRGGCSDGQVWYDLAALAARRGDPAEASRILARGEGIVGDAEWRDRMRQAARRLVPAGGAQRDDSR